MMKIKKILTFLTAGIAISALIYFLISRTSTAGKSDPFCTKQDLEFGYCAQGDFNGDGQVDLIGSIASAQAGKFDSFVQFGGQNSPTLLDQLQKYEYDVDDLPMTEISEASLEKDFKNLPFTTLAPFREKDPPENMKHFIIEKGRSCFKVVTKEVLEDGWGDRLKASTSRNLIEERPCDTAGGTAIYAFDHSAKKMIIYVSSFAGM